MSYERSTPVDRRDGLLLVATWSNLDPPAVVKGRMWRDMRVEEFLLETWDSRRGHLSWEKSARIRMNRLPDDTHYLDLVLGQGHAPRAPFDQLEMSMMRWFVQKVGIQDGLDTMPIFRHADNISSPHWSHDPFVHELLPFKAGPFGLRHGFVDQVGPDTISEWKKRADYYDSICSKLAWDERRDLVRGELSPRVRLHGLRSISWPVTLECDRQDDIQAKILWHATNHRTTDSPYGTAREAVEWVLSPRRKMVTTQWNTDRWVFVNEGGRDAWATENSTPGRLELEDEMEAYTLLGEKMPIVWPVGNLWMWMEDRWPVQR